MLLLLLACDTPPTTGSVDCSDRSGSWSLTEVIDRSGCDEPPQTVTFTARWRQEGCTGTLSVPGTGISLPGTISGDRITAEGDYRDLGRIHKRLVLDLTETGVTGTAEWTWAMGALLSCTGTSTITGTKR